MNAEKTLYVLVGGGSGGHLTPLIPVAESLKELNGEISVAHIGQKNDPLNKILTNNPAIDSQYEISAGKYRRYNGENILFRLFDVKTFVLNARDFTRFIFGTIQAWKLLGRLKPKMVFIKGGYVGAPVGIAAGFRGIPYITHDSDAMVSLANRLIAKRAVMHLTSMKPELYSLYDKSKTQQVGIPVRKEFKKLTTEKKESFRTELGFTVQDKVLLVLGGGLGAKNINDAVEQGSALLLSDKSVRLVNITGEKLHNEVLSAYKKNSTDDQLQRINILSFTTDLYKYSAVADVIITRAGATNLAEFAAQAKACVIVPNPLLAGGHQLSNAKAYEEQGAVLVVPEQDIKNQLVSTVIELLNNSSRQNELGEALYKLSTPDAALNIAQILNKTVKT